jgi:copper transport protein
MLNGKVQNTTGTRLIGSIKAIILLGFLFLAVRPVAAHADLLRSVPEANAMLTRPPVQIELFFTEPLDPGFSTIQVLDGRGQVVDNNDARVDPADATRLTVSLRSLPDGIYTVSWRALSAVDSHITTGAYPFAVGDVDAAALEAAAQASRQVSVSVGEIAARWLTYISTLALAGGAVFLLLVWGPTVQLAGAGDGLRRPWPRLAIALLGGLFLASPLWLLVQSGQVTGRELAWPWDPAVGQVLVTTRFGVLWLARLVLAMGLMAVQTRPAGRASHWLAAGLGLLLLLTISLGSHAAGQPAPLLPMLADWLHLIAASIWVGGLLYFLAGLFLARDLDGASRTALTARLIPRFSALALLSVAVLVLTGVYASLLHVGSLENLAGTTYGRILLVKLLLILPMVALGAVNLLLTSPRMKRASQAGQDGGRLVSRFRRLVTSEVTLGAAVLLSVGLLTTLPPARAPEAAAGLTGRQEVDDLAIELLVEPGRPGLNDFTVTVLQAGRPLNTAREVALQFTPATVDLPPTTAQLTAQGQGRYAIAGGYLPLPDAWQVQVAVRRDDAFDAFANFDFNVGTAVATSSFPWDRVGGALLVLGGILYLLAVRPQFAKWKMAAEAAWLPAGLLSLSGFVVFFWLPSQQPDLAVNPIAPNAESIAIGQQLYQDNCLSCHGVTGLGDGPVGRTLNPRPADLTQHTLPGVHPDGRLYEWITNGMPGTVMPAFDERLGDEERWHLVNYIRTLAQPMPAHPGM